MENENIDKEKIIEEMRHLRDTRQARIAELNKAQKTQEGVMLSEIILHEVKYLGKMEFIVEGREEPVQKDVYMIVEEVDGLVQYKYYDEDMQLLGMQRAIDTQIILSKDVVNTKKTAEQSKIAKSLEEKDKEKARTLEELEEEHKDEQKAKEAKVSQELSTNLGENKDLRITSYRRIVDKVFTREFPETCGGAQEIGMAYSEEMKAFVLVADYGNGFEIARGTEPAKATMEKYYDIDKEKGTVENESPHALMKMTGNNNPTQTTELAVEIGQYGYIETKVVRRTPNNIRVGEDVAEQGEERTSQEKTLAERDDEKNAGVDWARNKADLVAGRENSENEYMKQEIVDSIMQSHEEELESLYGDLQNQEAAIRRYIDKAVQNANITQEDIVQFVEANLEADYGAFFRDRTQH